MEPLTFGSLFAGIGGFDKGFEDAGMVCKFQVEIDPYCQKVLAKHWPNVARWDDVTTLTKEVIKEIINDQIKKGGTGEATASGTIDVLCGGFP